MSSVWVDIRNTVETLVGDAAPVVLGALGGPAGAAVGAELANALGVTGNDSLKTALLTDPTAAAKIKELEIEKGLSIAEMDSRARLAQIKLDQASVQKLGLLGAWEDVLGWVCAMIFAEAFLILPTAQAVAAWTHYTLSGWPVYNLGIILSVLGTLVGAGSLKAYRIRKLV